MSANRWYCCLHGQVYLFLLVQLAAMLAGIPFSTFTVGLYRYFILQARFSDQYARTCSPGEVLAAYRIIKHRVFSSMHLYIELQVPI